MMPPNVQILSLFYTKSIPIETPFMKAQRLRICPKRRFRSFPRVTLLDSKKPRQVTTRSKSFGTNGNRLRFIRRSLDELGFV